MRALQIEIDGAYDQSLFNSTCDIPSAQSPSITTISQAHVHPPTPNTPM